MCRKFYRFSNFYIWWGSSGVEVRDLDPGLSISTVGGAITNPFAGLNNWYGISGTTTFTISGNVTGDTTFTVVTRGSSCTEASLAYTIVVEPDPEVPDFVRMNLNSAGYEILESALVQVFGIIIQFVKIIYQLQPQLTLSFLLVLKMTF